MAKKTKKFKKYKHFHPHLESHPQILDNPKHAATHEDWSGYALALGAIESIVSEGKSSGKVAKRHRKTVKQLHKLAKHAGGASAVVPPKGKKKSSAKAKVKATLPNVADLQVPEEKPAAPLTASNVVPLIADNIAEKPMKAEAPLRAPNAFDAPLAGKPDDLQLISGVGPKLEKTLNALGIFHFDQIAAWSAEDVAWVDEHLRFPGRIGREQWIEQADALAVGGRDEYVRRFGKEPR